MSFTFNTDVIWSSLYYAFNADDSFIWYLWGNWNKTFFDWGKANDYVNLCLDRATWTKPNKIKFTITQWLDNWWAWYKIKIPIFNNVWWNLYNPWTIVEPTIISDTTNNLTQDWIIEFEIPDEYWNYWNLRAKSRRYSWQIILQTLWDTVTPLKADIRIIDYSVNIIDEWTDWDELNFEKIHNYLQTIDTSLSSKHFNQYFFNCWIHTKGWYFKSVSENVTFWRNFDIYIKSTSIQYWEVSAWYPVKWCSIKFTCRNWDFWWMIWYTNAKIYWLQYETIYEPDSSYSHWHWWGWIWSYSWQDLRWISILNMRSVSVYQTSNVVWWVKLMFTHFEPLWAILVDCLSVHYNQWIRTWSSNQIQYVHRFDSSSSFSRNIENRSSWRYDNIHNYFVDQKWNKNISYAWFQIHSTSTDEKLSHQHQYIVYSLELFVLNEKAEAIQWATWIIKDKDWNIVFQWITNIDWFLSDVTWTVTTASSNSIEDSNNPFPAYTWVTTEDEMWMYYQEIIITSWDNKWERRIIKKYNTATTCMPHIQYLKTLNEWDNFSKVIYINSIIVTPDVANKLNSSYTYWINDYRWPFTLEINKWDYIYKEVMNIDWPIKKDIIIKKQKRIVNSDLENLN